MNEIRAEAEAMKQSIIDDRRTLHMHPEIGMELPRTTAYVSKRLREMGYAPQKPIDSGVTADIGRPGKTILLRADMDALPTKEEADLPFCSKNDYGHLCGHDMHTAMLLGAAKLLKAHEDELAGTVKLMFQPGEERGMGARAMVEAGVTEGVDAALALHVDSMAKAGTISYVEGVVSTMMESFYITVQGRGGHGSSPHLTVDPLRVVVLIYDALNGLIGKEVDPAKTAVLTIGKLGGGSAVNIIPDTAEIWGAFRCYDLDVRDHLFKRVFEIVDHITKMMGATYTLTKNVSTPGVMNDPALCRALLPCVADILGEEALIRSERPMSGTEDFAHVTKKVPGMYMMLGAGGPGGYPMHNPNVVFDEDALPLGSAILAHCALRWLERK